MNAIIVNDDDGVECITGEDVTLMFLGQLHRPLEYDTAIEYINAILTSSLDGPDQMQWITTVAQEFLHQDD